MKGFLINTLNPFVFTYWIGAIKHCFCKSRICSCRKIVIFTVAEMCNFVGDLMKAFLAIKSALEFSVAVKSETFLRFFLPPIEFPYTRPMSSDSTNKEVSLFKLASL